MRIVVNPAREDWPSYTKRPVADLLSIREKVKPILDTVQKRGDDALQAYTREFDHVDVSVLEVTSGEIAEGLTHVGKELKTAIEIACRNITSFHKTQQEKTVRSETTAGITCWRESHPIESVGLYIPGGTAPLFSTVLMLAIPASIAGCDEVILCSPPDREGNIHPAILYAADLCGVHRIFKVGGSQAIAAMAYGTSTIPKVDKIFGPGNQYVTAAKQLVLQEGTAIDIPAGPSEVAVIADAESNPDFIAADLIAQAEHGPDSQVILLTDSNALTKAVVEQVNIQINDLPRKEIAQKAMDNSLALVFSDLDAAMDFSNLYAPEHLIINATNYKELAGRVKHAGSVFIGSWTPESLGDYASGTNHTLPTNGYARSYSGVSLDSFVKKITFQEASFEGLQNIADCVSTLALNENLEGHRRAVTIRLQNK